MGIVINHEPRRVREKMVHGDKGFTIIKGSDGKIGDIFSYIGMRIDFTLFDEFEHGQRREGFRQGTDHEIRVFCYWNLFFGIRVPIASREDHPALMHQGDGGAGDPLLLQLISDDGIEKGYRPFKISLFKNRSIWREGAAVQAKKDR
jgi:hypothetical protein